MESHLGEVESPALTGAGGDAYAVHLEIRVPPFGRGAVVRDGDPPIHAIGNHDAAALLEPEPHDAARIGADVAHAVFDGAAAVSELDLGIHGRIGAVDVEIDRVGTFMPAAPRIGRDGNLVREYRAAGDGKGVVV